MRAIRTAGLGLRVSLSVMAAGGAFSHLIDRNIGGGVMKVIAAAVVAGMCLGATSARAGPCSNEIAQFEQAVRRSTDRPNAGPTAPQSIDAQLRHQPTPGSVAQAQARAQTAFETALTRAKRLDARGDRVGCTEALAAARRMYELR
jgi:hypothetical protein